MGILEKIAKFWKPEGNENTKVMEPGKATFLLTFKDLTIGTLWTENSIWYFEYTDAYKNSPSCSALIDFPNKQRIYQSEALWPFFVHRIPGLKQPAVQEILRLEHIDPRDEVKLLRRFGQYNISNPYILQPA
jgi:HipA-like protein